MGQGRVRRSARLLVLGLLHVQQLHCTQDDSVVLHPSAGAGESSIASAGARPSAGAGGEPSGGSSGASGAPDAGTSGDGGAAPSTDSPIAGSGPMVCAEARPLGSSEELVERLAALPFVSNTHWTLYDESQAEPGAEQSTLAASEDLVATAAIELTPDRVARFGIPDRRDAGAGLRPAQLSLEKGGLGVAGLHCNSSFDEALDGPASLHVPCSSLIIDAGTRFRVRAIAEQTFPDTLPFFEFVRPCTQPCETDELRCAETQLCFSPRDFCGFCTLLRAEWCACSSPRSPLQAGDRCSYSSSPDFEQVGTCQAGTCAVSDL